MANEQRLIEANALQDEIRKSKDRHRHLDHKIAENHHMEHDVFLELVDYAPTVDAVEVVRCENCENAVPFSWSAAGERVQGFRCMKDEGAIGYKCCVSGDDFCASGKRRTKNADD